MDAAGPLIETGIPGIGGGVRDPSVSRGLPSIFYDDQGKLKMPWEPSHSTTDTTSPRAQAPDRVGQQGAAPGPVTNNYTVSVTNTMNGVADESTFQNLLRRFEDR